MRHLQPGLVFCLALLLAGCNQIQQPGANNGSSAPPAGVMNVADAAISGGDPSMALKVSQSVLANDPDNLDALYHEGAAYYALNRCMDAIAVYKLALNVDVRSSQAEVGIGRCLLKRNALQAEQAFAAAVQDDPDNAAAQNDLGVSRDLQNNHAGAIQPYQRALLLKPGDTATEVNLGMSLALSGDGDDALQYLGPLATSQEANAKIREDYAAALVAAGRDDEARAVLTVDLPPDSVNQLMADFTQAIAEGQPVASTASATAPAAAPATTPAIGAPAPIQAQPLAAAVPVAPAPAAAVSLTAVPATAPAESVSAPAVAAQAATPAIIAAPAPAIITPAASTEPASPPPASPPPASVAPASAAPAALPPSAIPSLTLDDGTASNLPPVTATNAGKSSSNGAAGNDNVVR